MSDEINIYFECKCYNDEHLLKFTYDPEYEYDSLYVTIFLKNQKWYKRIWLGLQYIFGYKSKYGHFDNFVLNPEDANRFYNLAKKFKDLQTKN